MTERVDNTALAFPIGHIVSRVVRVGTSRSGSLEHPVEVLDPEHDLICRHAHALIVCEFTHYYLSALAVDTELDAVSLADADVLNQPKYLDIPGVRSADIGHGEHGDKSRSRR